MSVQRVKQETTATELIVWSEFLIQKSYEYSKDNYFQAMIAAEIRRWKVKEPQRVTIKDFMPDLKPKEIKQLTCEEATRRSKDFWLSFVGIKDY